MCLVHLQESQQKQEELEEKLSKQTEEVNSLRKRESQLSKANLELTQRYSGLQNKLQE